MKWTKEHSSNAVAARQRNRMSEPDFSGEVVRHVRMPRGKARYQLTLRDWKYNDSLTISLSELPWKGRFVTHDRKEMSTSRVAEIISNILNSQT